MYQTSCRSLLRRAVGFMLKVRDLRIPAKPNVCSGGNRTAFRDDPEHHRSEGWMAAARMLVWGKGQQSLAPPQHPETPGARIALWPEPENDLNLLADSSGPRTGSVTATPLQWINPASATSQRRATRPVEDGASPSSGSRVIRPE